MVKPIPKTLLAVYLFILLWLVLFKFSSDPLSVLRDYHTRSLNLIPFAGSSRESWAETVSNLVVFVPFGLLLSVNLKRATFWRKLAVICIFSIAVEVIQFILAIGTTDITDVITNTVGGSLGLILYNLVGKYVDDEKLDRFIILTSVILLVVCIILFRTLSPHGIRYRSAH
jgi:glycopeptide antibiotics resistance protein